MTQGTAAPSGGRRAGAAPPLSGHRTGSAGPAQPFLARPDVHRPRRLGTVRCFCRSRQVPWRGAAPPSPFPGASRTSSTRLSATAAPAVIPASHRAVTPLQDRRRHGVGHTLQQGAEGPHGEDLGGQAHPGDGVDAHRGRLAWMVPGRVTLPTRPPREGCGRRGARPRRSTAAGPPRPGGGRCRRPPSRPPAAEPRCPAPSAWSPPPVVTDAPPVPVLVELPCSRATWCWSAHSR